MRSSFLPWSGFPSGVASAVRRDTLVDHISRFISITGLALPVFWLALMTQFLFYGKLNILPDGQRLPIGVDPPRPITRLYTVDSLLEGNFHLFWISVQHLIMPVMVLAYGSLAVVTRMVRGGMLEVLNQDYIRTARAKGLANKVVVNRHALKNALLPTVTSTRVADRTVAVRHIPGRDHLLVAGDRPLFGRCNHQGRLQRHHGDNADRGGHLRAR